MRRVRKAVSAVVREVWLCRQLGERVTMPVLAICVLDLEGAALTAGAAAFLRTPVEPVEFVTGVGGTF